MFGRAIPCLFTASVLLLAACGPRVDPPLPFVEIEPQKKTVPFDQISPGYTVNAMVGQINGQPIYAEEIFQEIKLGGANLERLGAESTRQQFLTKATELIRGTLMRRLENELVRSEAKRELTPMRQREIDATLQHHREKLLALYGKGSLREADANLRDQKGHGLEQALDQERERVLIRNHMRNKIGFKVHVTQRDIKQYFELHRKKFNTDPTLVRVIVVNDAQIADTVDQALATTDFDQIGRAHSILAADTGGLLVEYQGVLQTFDATGWDPLNQAIQKLSPDGHTPRIQIRPGHWAWAKLERLSRGPKKLEDVYLQIENTLHRQRIKQLQDAYRHELLNRHATSIEKMIKGMMEQLVQVAITRYTSEEDVESSEEAEGGTDS